MNEPVVLDEENAPQIAAFTRVACSYDLLTTNSVRRAIFADPDPQVVLGVYTGGLEAVGAGVVRGERGWVKFLAVHPVARGRGLGSSLLEHLESFCRRHGAKSVEIGTSAPYYVVPGVDVRLMEATTLLGKTAYERCGEALNLAVRLNDLPDPALPVRPADSGDLEAIRPWVASSFGHWLDELHRGVSLGACFVHEDVGFACFDVNREGWFGPMATKPGHGGRGVGTATLLGALGAMKARGYERAEIAWAAAEEFYGKAVGARASRVFRWYRKPLD